jgi:succinate-acetate transporter protein
MSDQPTKTQTNDHGRALAGIAESLKELSKEVNPPVPNPAPLGLITFGLTTALLMVKPTKLGGDSAADMKGVDIELMGFALFFGGLVQVSNR